MSQKRQTKTLLDQLVANSATLANQLVLGLSSSAKSYVLAQIQKANQLPIIYITPNTLQANQMYDDLQFFFNNDEVYLFPIDESLAAEHAIASSDFAAKRVEALDFLLSNKPGIVVIPSRAIRKRISSPQVFQSSSVTLKVGNDIDKDALLEQLTMMGYIREKMVTGPGQFSVRGGIIDVYTIVDDKAIRIELFDTEIDSIRQFDVETQKSIETLEEVKILPTLDVIFTKEQLNQSVVNLDKVLKKNLAKIEDDAVSDRIENFFHSLIERLKAGERPENLTLYTDLLYKDSFTLLDYLNATGLVILDENTRILEQERHDQLDEEHWHMQKVQEGIVLPTQKFKLSFKDVIKKSEHRKLYLENLHKGLGRLSFNETYNFQYRSIPQFFSQMPLIKTEVDRWLQQGRTLIMLVRDDERAKKVQQTFADFLIDSRLTHLNEVTEQTVNIVVGTLHNGFELPDEELVVLTEKELFNKVTKVIPKRQNLSNAERIKSYTELEPGDYVVHVNHGIGRYQGMETLEIGAVKQDYMSIIYQDDAKLFIPVTQIHLVQKYVASDSKTPKINKLGGTEWAKTKKKVARKIEDIADELIELYAKREAEIGYAFEKDTKDQKDFEDAFAYVETVDQLRSAKEIKQDMEKAKPMDRLLVGDVGYGKTEVAMRAIFKAVQEGKQVAFLVPTTILAQQHYMTLVNRFEGYPFKIALMSRFRTKAQQEETIEELKTGKVDIVVGTHRILSKDVIFSDLGLLVVDEEQRFGVRHKERLKQLKSHIDVLTLTATPIPRTLHMSMLGVRDLSVIETPPENRYPVQTYVVEQDDGVIKDAISRELARGGQVFYLYNRVVDIQEKAEHLRELIPEARIAYAHGQLSEVQLENVLLEFMAGEYDVLVTTTIVETGVDMPNVNTLFIENADQMGLSQLYQLRGRVGRTNRIAYAYFMFKPDKSLNEIAQKRLEAIKEFTQLGAGFKIAMRDLSIRGAGNLLGQQQHGFIDSVGFDLYSEMLKEAVSLKQNGISKKVNTVEIDLGITAYIPANYIEDERQKIDLYKRIRMIDSLETYREIQDDMIDRFGNFPDEVADLLTIGLLKHYAEQQGVEKIQRKEHVVSVTYTKEKSKLYGAPEIFKQLNQTKLKAVVQNEKEQVIIRFDIQKQQVSVWLDELCNYLKNPE